MITVSCVIDMPSIDWSCVSLPGKITVNGFCEVLMH